MVLQTVTTGQHFKTIPSNQLLSFKQLDLSPSLNPWINVYHDMVLFVLIVCVQVVLSFYISRCFVCLCLPLCVSCNLRIPMLSDVCPSGERQILWLSIAPLQTIARTLSATNHEQQTHSFNRCRLYKRVPTGFWGCQTNAMFKQHVTWGKWRRHCLTQMGFPSATVYIISFLSRTPTPPMIKSKITLKASKQHWSQKHKKSTGPQLPEKQTSDGPRWWFRRIRSQAKCP